MRVLLVYPNARQGKLGHMDRAAIAEPLALEYVAAGARLDGHEVRLLDLRLHVDALDESLLAFRPDVVGVTGFSMHVLRGLEVCARAKQLLPGCKTAAGGLHATFEPVDFFEPQMDYVFVGQGVQAFRQVLGRLERGESVTGVPGVYARANGRFEYGGEPEAFDIASLPHPDRTLVPEDRACYVIETMKPIALLRTSAGCPFRCTFCSVWRITCGKYLGRAADDVVAELRAIPERHVHLTDDEPFLDARRMAELAERIREQGIDKEYYAYCRVDTFLRNPELMRQWAAVGLRVLFMGFETIFETEAEEYNKRQGREDFLAAQRMARELGLSIWAGFIVHPRYTQAEFDELRAFLLDNRIEYASFSVWTPLPGTQEGGTSYDQVTSRQPNGRPDWSEFDFQHPVVPTALPKDEFQAQLWRLYETSRHGQARDGADAGATPPGDVAGAPGQVYAEDMYVRLARFVLGGGARGPGVKR